MPATDSRSSACSGVSRKFMLPCSTCIGTSCRGAYPGRVNKRSQPPIGALVNRGTSLIVIERAPMRRGPANGEGAGAESGNRLRHPLSNGGRTGRFSGADVWGAPDLRVGEDVEVVAARGGELRDDRALRP